MKPPPFSPQVFTSDEITDISLESHEHVKKILEVTMTGRQFIPPSLQGTIIFPGFDGGGEWGGAAVDPESGIMYVNSSVMPWILTMVKSRPDSGMINSLGKQSYRINCAVCHGTELQGDPSGTYPDLHKVRETYTPEGLLKLMETGKGLMPSFLHLREKEKAAIIDFLSGKESITGNAEYNPGMPYTFTGYNRFFDPSGYPAIKPPWGLITAIDLNEGSILWQVPLGEYKELSEKGIPATGSENYGGPVVTAGGLVFIGASKDEYIRAFDKESGKELWKYKLPAGGYATPCVYMAGGRQFLVIACGGGKMGTASGDSYVAFSLPE